MSKMPALFQAYRDLVIPCTESPLIYHDWCLVSGIATLLGRQAFIPFGFKTQYANMYICLIGGAGGRKSSAISVLRSNLELAGFKRFSKERSSKERFVADLSKMDSNIPATDFDLSVEMEDELQTPCEVLIAAGELQDFLGPCNTDFIGMLTNLFDNLPKYENPKLTGKDVYVYQPTINMLGGCTPTTFTTTFPPEIVGSGFLSRMIMVNGGGARQKLTLPPPPDMALQNTIVETLGMIRETVKGPMVYTTEAFQMIDTLYTKAKHPLTDPRFDTYINRRHEMLNKVCMVAAAADLSTTIEAHHVEFANTLLYVTEMDMPKALGEFGKSDNNAQAEAIVALFDRNATPLDSVQIFKALGSDFNSLTDCAKVVQKLLMTGKLTSVGSNGKVTAIPKAIDTGNFPYIDIPMLGY